MHEQNSLGWETQGQVLLALPLSSGVLIGMGHEYGEPKLEWMLPECVGAQFGRCWLGTWDKRLELVLVECGCREHPRRSRIA